MQHAILQSHLPHAPWIDPVTWRLPGIRPIAPEDWLIRDDAFAAQMALRDRLIDTRPEEVHEGLPTAEAAALECLDLVIETLERDPSYTIAQDTARRPDGVLVQIDRTQPLMTLGRLQQADICLMEAGADGHVLTGAILCFPAHWTLAEKIGKPLPAIHRPVDEFTPDLAKRVQRLFDALKPGQVLCRGNALPYEEAELFTPKSETTPVIRRKMSNARYVRSERQTLRRLPKSGAVVFTIHTFMVAVENLSAEQAKTLATVEKG